MKRTTLYVLSAVLLLIQFGCSDLQSPISASDSSFEGDNYQDLDENPFQSVADEPISTFSIDADGASYANVRRFLQADQVLPPEGAIRTEEMINYFELDYPYLDQGHPIALNGEVSSCPWAEDHRLVRIGIKGKPLSKAEVGGSNFVFLIDVSGSMSSDDKLGLLKAGFNHFVDQMSAEDRIAIVTYAGSDKVVLESTSGQDKNRIREAIDGLSSGGGTNGAQGIITAYEIAQANFITGGNNRIILGTDGDFNIGVTNHNDLISLIEEKRASGVFLTVLGVGRGNYNDHNLEQIANHGNGTLEYIDKLEQMYKVFEYDFSKFYTVAKDVKVQVEFNPANVAQYRLIGYENRLLQTNDFANDSVDAGEIGANQNITALYEIVPTTAPLYRTEPSFTVDFRYKLPDSDVSNPMELKVYDEEKSFTESSAWMKFTASVASFSMLLRNSAFAGDANYGKIHVWLSGATDYDPHGFKQEFKQLLVVANSLQ